MGFRRYCKVQPSVSSSRKIRLNSDYYIANILDKLVNSAFQRNVTDGNIAQVRLFNDNDLSIFQQDGARCHTSAKTTNWLDDNIPLHIKPKDWQPLSRPFSYRQSVEYPITKCLPRSGADECFVVKRRLQQAWRSVEVEMLQTLIESMPDRILAVIKQNGNIVKY